MSDDVVIRVEGLGKKYLIGHEAERERYVALRDVIEPEYPEGLGDPWGGGWSRLRGRLVPGTAIFITEKTAAAA